MKDYNTKQRHQLIGSMQNNNHASAAEQALAFALLAIFFVLFFIASGLDAV